MRRCLEVAVDHVITDVAEVGWIPARLSVLVDQLRADSFEKVVPILDIADHAILPLQTAGEIVVRTFP